MQAADSTNHHFPYQTGYRRPEQRKFWVWRCRVTRYRAGHSAWRWCCTLCEPPSYGYRTVRDGWFRIITESMPRHMRNRRQHHEWVARVKPDSRRAHI